MRGILINPYIKTIAAVKVTDDIESIYRSMSWLLHTVEIVQVATIFANSDNLLVDEEGLMKPQRPMWKLNGQPYVGCALLLGADEKTGEWTSAKTLLTELQVYVRWSTQETTGDV